MYYADFLDQFYESYVRFSMIGNEVEKLLEGGL